MDEIGVDIDSRPILAQLLASIGCMFRVLLVCRVDVPEAYRCV